MKKHNYDERQEYARGKAFQYACITFLIEILVMEFLREYELLDCDPFAELEIFISLPMLVLFWATISRDAYDPVNSRPGIVLFTLAPLVGILSVAHLLRDHAVLIDGSCLTEDFGMIVLDGIWIIGAAIYWTYYLRERREEIREAKR